MAKTGAEATDNVPAELLKQHPQLFGHDVALDTCYTHYDYTSRSDIENTAKGVTAQLTWFYE